MNCNSSNYCGSVENWKMSTVILEGPIFHQTMISLCISVFWALGLCSCVPCARFDDGPAYRLFRSCGSWDLTPKTPIVWLCSLVCRWHRWDRHGFSISLLIMINDRHIFHHIPYDIMIYHIIIWYNIVWYHMTYSYSIHAILIYYSYIWFIWSSTICHAFLRARPCWVGLDRG